MEAAYSRSRSGRKGRVRENLLPFLPQDGGPRRWRRKSGGTLARQRAFAQLCGRQVTALRFRRRVAKNICRAAQPDFICEPAGMVVWPCRGSVLWEQTLQQESERSSLSPRIRQGEDHEGCQAHRRPRRRQPRRRRSRHVLRREIQHLYSERRCDEVRDGRRCGRLHRGASYPGRGLGACRSPASTARRGQRREIAPSA